MFLWICGLLVQCTAAVSSFLSKNFQAGLNLQAQQLLMAFLKVKSGSPSKSSFSEAGGMGCSLIPIVILIMHIWFKSSDSDKNLMLLSLTKQISSEGFILSRSTMLLKSLQQSLQVGSLSLANLAGRRHLCLQGCWSLGEYPRKISLCLPCS